MITLAVNGKVKAYNNKEGIKIIRKYNPDKEFKIAKCKYTEKQVVMVKEQFLDYLGNPIWICLHD